MFKPKEKGGSLEEHFGEGNEKREDEVVEQELVDGKQIGKKKRVIHKDPKAFGTRVKRGFQAKRVEVKKR